MDPSKLNLSLSMDKVYRRYLEALKNPDKVLDECGLDPSELPDGLPGNTLKESELSNEEKQYLTAVEKGDIPKVRHFLGMAQIYFNININCVDPRGRTALQISIENDNTEMVEVLLSFNVEIGDALLHAINEEHVDAVELILAQQPGRKKDLSQRRPALTILDKSGPDNLAFLGGSTSSSFTPDITPLILAAHRDNYEIIKILLDRGDQIPKPHDIRCNCSECKSKSSDDSLNYSRSRINAYRALSSPSLISLSSKDPILTAFELSVELKRLSRLENEFKLEYETLATQCQDFGVDLLNETRTSQELETVLNFDPGSVADEENDRMNLARLTLAIKYKQKKFVAHPNCQQLLSSLWYEGLPGFRRRPIVFKIILTVSVCLLYPVLSVIYMIIPNSSVGKFMRRPFIKFICHSASYMTFLFLLILASQRIDSIVSLGDGKSRLNREVRGAPPTSIEWMILAYVLGLIWVEVKQLWELGLKEYLQDLWNILDFMTNSLYIATYVLKLVAYLNVQREKRLGEWDQVNAPRDNWDAFDPNLISEALFATANIFSTLKLVYIFTINPHLGPLQITLGRMVTDIVRFLLIAALVLFSYACGVNQLYWYYAEERVQQCNKCGGGKACACDRTLSNLFEILQTLYFAIYGLVDISHFELQQNHSFTQFVGKLMFGSYSAIMIIVLINMLIAMLSNSFQYISNAADTEWKYARAKLWMSYFEKGGTVPPPLNIIPTPKNFWYAFIWMKNKCTCTKLRKTNKWNSVKKVMQKLNEKEKRYHSVMRALIKRYIMKRQLTNQAYAVTEDDINELKQDISSFRFELLEIFRSNNMKMPQFTSSVKGKSSNRQRRKGSRHSLDRQFKDTISMEPVQEDMYELPKFLAKDTSQETMNSDSFVADSRDLDSISLEMQPMKSSLEDEGLGESVDKLSLYTEKLNGIKSSAPEILPEESEKMESNNHAAKNNWGRIPKSVSEELTLDATQLTKTTDPKTLKKSVSFALENEASTSSVASPNNKANDKKGKKHKFMFRKK